MCSPSQRRRSRAIEARVRLDRAELLEQAAVLLDVLAVARVRVQPHQQLLAPEVHVREDEEPVHQLGGVGAPTLAAQRRLERLEQLELHAVLAVYRLMAEALAPR